MSTQNLPKFPIALPPNADYRKQSVEVPGTKRPGQTAHRRIAYYPFKTVDSPDVPSNLLQLFDVGLAASKGGLFLGHRPVVSTSPLQYANHFEWETFTSVDRRRREVGSALHMLFQTGVLGGGDMPTVGIWSKNCPNWLLVDFACHAYGKVQVSLYDTLGKDAVEYIINHAELSVIFANPQHIPTLLALAPKVPRLKMIVSMEALDEEPKEILRRWGQTVNVQVKDIKEIEEVGRANLIDVIPATSATIATICYTSGTSGWPKGVVLNHGNLATAAYGFMHNGKWDENRINMSFLPLAHVFQRIMELIATALGVQIGYGSGDPLRFLEDVQILRPYAVPLVPRVLNRLYGSVKAAGDAPGLKGRLFRQAVATKLHNYKTQGVATHALWDRIVFRKVNQVLGGRLQMIMTGAAPLSADVKTFLTVTTLAEIYEGMYGMTENSGACSAALPGDSTSGGSVGTVLPTGELKLLDIPALGYSTEDKPFPRGEILMRGGSRFVCYYKDEEKTREALDDEGWLHTGDVGLFDECGRLRIIDRVKNIMKLAQGEYVALEQIESVYSSSTIVAQLFVYGNSLQSYLVGVIVPDPLQFSALISRDLGENVAAEDVAVLEKHAQNPRIVSAVLKLLEAEAEKRKLKGFERLKHIHVTMDAFSVDNGCLTPTFKVKRKEAYEKFKAPIEAFYALPDTSSKL